MLAGYDISKSYAGNRVLGPISMELRPGSATVLVGPSGSGKTTLIKALSLLDPPDAGTVALEDRRFTFPAPGLGDARPWPRVTVVFQQLFLWPHLTLRENIRLPLLDRDGAGAGFPTEICDSFGINALLDRRPAQVSMGERQRAALARAFALEPAYLLLDEITSALDVEQAAGILHSLRELRGRGIALLLSTHQLGFARALVGGNADDRVAFLDRGAILEDGPPELLDSPRTDRFRRFLADTRLVA